MRILFVRHGESLANLEHKLDTTPPGRPLTPRGRAQATAWARSVAARSAAVRAIRASAMLRARETASALAQISQQQVEIDSRLGEVQTGDLEALPGLQATAAYRRILARWADGETALRIPGGESADEAVDRVGAAIEDLVEAVPDGVAVVVSHASAIRLWTCATARGASLAMATNELGNAAEIEVEQEADGGWRLQSWDGVPAALPSATGGLGPSPGP
ncbi:MAG: histidine phosphatase family protein [Solirubrobacterales bacterium]